MRIGMLLLLLALPLAAQMVEGDVVDAISGAPVSGVSIRSSTASLDQSLVFTDTAGHFRMQRPDSEDARAVILHRVGYLDQNRMLATAGDASEGRFQVKLIPQAVIAGKVVDEDGIPVGGVLVSAVLARKSAGVRRFFNYQVAVESNEKGEYRVYGLRAGRYFIRVETRGRMLAWDSRYPMQYRGGTTQPADDGAVEVKAGQEVRNADVVLKRFEGVTLSVRLSMPPEVGPSAINGVQLRAADGYVSYSPFWRRQADGKLELRHVPPGNYTIFASTGNRWPPQAGDWVASQETEVGDSDLSGIELNVQRLEARILAGVVVRADGSAAGSLRVALQSAYGNQVAAAGEDGSFTLKGVVPGHYHVTTLPMSRMRASDGEMAPRHVVPTAIRFGDADVLENGLDVEAGTQESLRITVADLDAIMMGTVLDSGGHPAQATIHFVRVGQPTIRFSGMVDEAGKFRVQALAGTYRVYMQEPDVDYAVMEDPDYLSAHANDYPALTIASGETSGVILRPAK